MTGVPVTVDDPGSIRLLVVEDDDDQAALLDGIFHRNPDFATALERASTLGEGVTRARDGEFDAVLLDLGLPDSDGLGTARRMLDVVEPPTAVVVFTSQRDQNLASQALELGVQDYVVKEDITPQLVTRVVRYGVTRAQLVLEVEQARAGESRERELRRLERMSAESSTTSISAAMLGDQTVAQRLGDRYEPELVAEYRRILDRMLDEQAYRGGETTESDLRSLAGVLGFLGAGPRDVIELHTTAVRQLVRDADPTRAGAVVEEARVAVLQLMGRLVGHYRDRSIGAGRGSTRTAVRHSSEDRP